ncbi:MAG: hypothetical protein ABL917_02285 [Parcubacteria group bacterium]
MTSTTFLKKLSARALSRELSENQKANLQEVLRTMGRMLNKKVNITKEQIEEAFLLILNMIGDRESGGSWKSELLPIVTWLQTCNHNDRW